MVSEPIMPGDLVKLTASGQRSSLVLLERVRPISEFVKRIYVIDKQKTWLVVGLCVLNEEDPRRKAEYAYILSPNNQIGWMNASWLEHA